MYVLNNSDYNFYNILTCRLAFIHWKKAQTETFIKAKIWHISFALAEAIPLIGNIIALFESIIVKGYYIFKAIHKKLIVQSVQSQRNDFTTQKK